MGMTMTQKILARSAGLDQVEAGQLIGNGGDSEVVQGKVRVVGPDPRPLLVQREGEGGGAVVIADGGVALGDGVLAGGRRRCANGCSPHRRLPGRPVAEAQDYQQRGEQNGDNGQQYGNDPFFFPGHERSSCFLIRRRSAGKS